jgi:hypothetical protein
MDDLVVRAACRAYCTDQAPAMIARTILGGIPQITRDAGL